MGDINIVTSVWREVELGRIVLINSGVFKGKLAAVVEIIDHKRVLIDNPTTNADKKQTVPRTSFPLAHLSLTGIVIPKLPRGVGTGPLRKQWEAAEVDKKWEESAWAKSKAKLERRRELSDFERFKVMRLKKQQRSEVRKSLAKVRAAAKA